MASSLKDEIGKRKPFDSPAQEAYLNLLRTFTVLEAEIARTLKSRGLSESTYNILRILRGERLGGARGVSCNVIGERLIARVPDMTRLIDRLEKSGLVTRGGTPDDRRVVLISITPKGLRLLDQLDRPLAALHEKQLSHMSKAELKSLNALLFKARHPDRAGA